MTDTELLQVASDNLKDTCDKIVEIAKSMEYTNHETPQVRSLKREFDNQLTLCFTLKQAFQDTKRLPNKPQE